MPKSEWDSSHSSSASVNEESSQESDEEHTEKVSRKDDAKEVEKKAGPSARIGEQTTGGQGEVGVKTAVSRAMGLVEGSQRRGSIILQRRNTASTLEPLAAPGSPLASRRNTGTSSGSSIGSHVAAPSPALDRRQLGLRRRGTATGDILRSSTSPPASRAGSGLAAPSAETLAVAAELSREQEEERSRQSQREEEEDATTEATAAAAADAADAKAATDRKKARRGKAAAAKRERERSRGGASKSNGGGRLVPKAGMASSRRERCLDLCRRAGLFEFAKMVQHPDPRIAKHVGGAIDSLYQSDCNTVGVEAGGFKHFLKLAKSDDAVVGATSLWSLATIIGIAFSGDDAVTQEQGVKEGMLKVCLLLLSSPHHEVPVAAAALLGNMLLLESVRERILKKHGLVRLLESCRSNNAELVRTVLVALANLASEEDCVEALVAAGAIPFFLQAAQQLRDPAAKQAAMAGIANVANSPMHAELGLGAIDTAERAMHDGDLITLRAAMQTVANLSSIEENRGAIANKCLASLMQYAATRDVRVQHCIATAMNNLCQDRALRQRVLDAGGESAVKKLMFSVDEDVRGEAQLLFKALSSHSAPRARKGTLREGESEVDKEASKQFVLGQYEQFKAQRAREAGGGSADRRPQMDEIVSRLDEVLRSESIGSEAEVIGIIKDAEARAAKAGASDKYFREAGGVAMLVTLVVVCETDNLPVVNQALTTLHVLMRLNSRNILAIATVEHASIIFLRALDMPPSVDKLNVVNLLGALADVSHTRAELIDYGGVERLVHVLSDEVSTPDVVGSTTEVLAKLCSEDTAVQAVVQEVGFASIFEVLNTTKSTDVQCQLLRLVAALGFNNRLMQEQVRRKDKLPIVVKFLYTSNFLLQEYAVRALLTLVANDHKNKDAARKAGALEGLVSMLGSSKEMVVKSAVRAISEIALSESKAKDALRKAGALEVLGGLLSTNLVVGGSIVTAKGTVMTEMVDCTLSTYVLECISVVCMQNSNNQKRFASSPTRISQVAELTTSRDLREVYHAINAMEKVARNNKKVKKEVLAHCPILPNLLAGWAKHPDERLASLAEAASQVFPQDKE